MVAATITAKGQTTIPKSIRTHLDLAAGDRIEFVVVLTSVVAAEQRRLGRCVGIAQAEPHRESVELHIG